MTKNKPLKVVIDTNLLISSLILNHGNPYELLQARRRKAFVLLISHGATQEIAEVLMRPKYKEKYHITQVAGEKLLLLLQNEALHTRPASSIPVTLRDPKDEKILALAIGGQAEYLVTGDRDLLVLKTYTSGEILTVGAFLKLLAFAEEKGA